MPGLAERGAAGEAADAFVKEGAEGAGVVAVGGPRGPGGGLGFEGGDDDVTPVRMGAGHIFVGLPEREGRLLGELLRGGDVGSELSMDPPTPIVVGLYPMRPISRS